MSDDRASDLNGSCALCHEGDLHDLGGLNPYGQALAPFITGGSTEADILAAFAAVENSNSDGNPGGHTNIVEINADTQPGWQDGDSVPASLVGDPLDPTEVLPDIAVNPTTIDYGSVIVGTSVTGTEITISNVGSDVLTVESLTLTGDPVFALGVQTPGTPFDVAAGANQKVGVVYTPDAEGLDTGALLVGSNDPDEPEVTVALQGTGITTTDPCFPTVDPRELSFGPVIVDTTLELPVTLSNQGVGTCSVEVNVPTCVDGEFILTSSTMFDLDAGESEIITVAYTPINLGEDTCRIDIDTDANDLKVPMNGEGTFALPTDLDILRFSALRTTSLILSRGIVLMSIVKNNGDGEGPGLLTITGMQNGKEFIHQILEVSNTGVLPIRIRLQPYIATEVGEILWTAELQDGDPDIDVATDTTIIKR